MIKTCWRKFFPYLNIECPANNLLYYYECCGFYEVECCVMLYSWIYYIGLVLTSLMVLIIVFLCGFVCYNTIFDCWRKKAPEIPQIQVTDEEQALVSNWSMFEKVGLI